MITKTAPRAASAPGNPASASGRMRLDSVHRGTRQAPGKALLTGVEGIGKSTWGGEAPDPVFIAAEDGILLAHATIRTFSNPAGANFDRYEMKLQRSAAALVKEWTDANLFAIHEDFIQDPKERKSKAFSTGRRVVHTERTSAWDAKNRYGLPPELPLSYADFAAARAAGQPADPKALRREADRLLAQLELDEATLAKTRAWLDAQSQRGATALAKAVDRLRSKVAEKGAE